MFDNLKKAFSDVSKGFSEKELKESDIDDILFQLEIALQDTNQQRQQIAANLEQGKQQMQNLIQKSQNPTK